jgi:hypothetical protein
MRARAYTADEVQDIFRASEGSPSPVARWHQTGHSGRDHVNPGKERLADDLRFGPTGAPRLRPADAKASFLTFTEQVAVATELLNSPAGQQQLQQLDVRGAGADVRIEGDVAVAVRIHFNITGMRDDTRLIPWHRFVLLVGATVDGIYFHSCFPQMSV